MFASIFVFAVLPLAFVTVGAEDIANSPYEQEDYFCVLPAHPEHGSYSVLHYPYAIPGEKYSSVKLDISCDKGYRSNNTIKSIYCVNGDWSALMPVCVQDFSECGLTTQHQLEGTNHLELPWHAGIYKKASESYSYRCGGSLITDTKIISSARCFHDSYNVVLLPASDFKVAVNKMYYEYNDTRDRNSQYSDVTDIKIPSNYRGDITNFEHNIAVVIVKTPFSFHKSVRAVCLDFDHDLDRTQLTEGNSGKTVYWSDSVPRYEVLDYKYVKNEDCLNMLSTCCRPLLTEDKFCARYSDDRWGEITYYGSGLVFLDPTSQRYYVRGVTTYYGADTNPPRTCVTVNKEEGICVKTSLCMKAEERPLVDPTTQFIFREALPCQALQSCCLRKNVRNDPRRAMVSNVHDLSGLSNPGANGFRITDSRVGFADFGDFPWMVALIRKDKENNDWIEKYAGGGALIHPSVVITAAHKVDDYEASEIKIRAGEWDPSTDTEQYPYQERDVSKIMIHEDYFKIHGYYNVALLILKSPVELSDAPHIIVACLVSELPPPGTRCYGMGWGKDSFEGPQYSHQLKKGQSSRLVVVGLVTYSISCGGRLPAAYVNIPEVYDWVGGRLTLEGFNKTSFVY